MNLDNEWWLARWRAMLLIRRAEEAIACMVETGEARCPCHFYIGQEAIAAGVCAALRREDSVWGGHRSHGHYLAKGGSLEGLFAEILGKANGCSGGRGGSMHLFAPEEGILGTVPIVAATVPLAAGAALAYKMRGEKRVAVAFFGDGTLEEGHVHETFNLAALYRLPLVFVCENNLYASHMHWTERRLADNLHEAGAFHSIPGQRVDGNDVEAVFLAANQAVERARGITAVRPCSNAGPFGGVGTWARASMWMSAVTAGASSTNGWRRTRLPAVKRRWRRAEFPIWQRRWPSRPLSPAR